jgi:hypothetical protein
MRTIARIMLAALMTLGVARAQDACKADVEKLCAGIPQGGGRIAACLKANEAQVSPACKQQVQAVAKKVREVGDACRADVEKFCAEVPLGHGATLKCLASNGANLTAPCQQVVQRVQEKAADFKKACGDDVAKFCKGIPQGRGRILACLKSKQAELAPACQSTLQGMWAQPAAPAPGAAPASAAPAAAAPAAAAPAAAAPAAPAAAAPAAAAPAAPAAAPAPAAPAAPAAAPTAPPPAAAPKP